MANPAPWMKAVTEELRFKRDWGMTGEDELEMMQVIARHAPSEEHPPMLVRRESGEIYSLPSEEQVRELVEAAEMMCLHLDLHRDGTDVEAAERVEKKHGNAMANWYIRLRRALKPFARSTSGSM